MSLKLRLGEKLFLNFSNLMQIKRKPSTHPWNPCKIVRHSSSLAIIGHRLCWVTTDDLISALDLDCVSPPLDAVIVRLSSYGQSKYLPADANDWLGAHCLNNKKRMKKKKYFFGNLFQFYFLSFGEFKRDCVLIFFKATGQPTREQQSMFR